MKRHVGSILVLIWGVVGCQGKSPPNDAGATATDSGIGSGTGQDDAASEDTSADAASGGTISGGESTAGGSDTSAETGSATGNDPGDPADCGGKTYACGDGEDNDGDGKVDLLDPECTGPCDDDESSFQTGIPGDNMDCKQDCFFDGNSGQGDDGCAWNLKCDPQNPGVNVGCAYTGGNNCDNQPEAQSPECIEFCEQYVPPGCDCFGCCEVQTDRGSVFIFLNSHPDCALDNIDACESCTYQADDCGDPCNPEDCDLCFGQDPSELPAGCDEPSCATGNSCTGNADCPTDHFCYLSCCYPPPVG